MIISKSSNINFNSRNSQIRQADRFLRIMNGQFPTTSPSKLSRLYSPKIDSNPQINKAFENMLIKFAEMTRGQISNFHYYRNESNYYHRLLDALKKYKLANCDELTTLTKLIFDLNGKTIHKATLIPSNIDHVVCVFNKNGEEAFNKTDFKNTSLNKLKDTIIVDPWLGFADFAPNAALKYQGEFHKLIGNPLNVKNNDSYINIVNLDNFYLNPTSKIEMKISKKTRNSLQKHYPELFLKQY